MSTKHWSDKTVLQFITVKRPTEYAGLSLDQVQELRSSSTFSPMGFLWSSNNSVTVDDEFWALVRKPVVADTQMSPLEAHAKEVFQAICVSAYADGTGEPGFINSHKQVQNDTGWSDLNRGDSSGWPGNRSNKTPSCCSASSARLAILP